MGPDEARAIHRAVCVVVASVFSVPRDSLLRRTKGPGFAHTNARQVAMYFAHIRGIPLVQVGKLFGGRHFTTVGHAVRIVEDKRDDPGFDAKLDEIETAIIAAISGD